jgi:hypothetical protein
MRVKCLGIELQFKQYTLRTLLKRIYLTYTAGVEFFNTRDDLGE